LKIDVQCLHNIVFQTIWPQLTHAAVARSLCDSRASCCNFSVTAAAAAAAAADDDDDDDDDGVAVAERRAVCKSEARV